jgi:galactose mutarotase-like enzyme
MYAGNPLLFPLVSFNHTDGHPHHYEWQGSRFPLPQHGFARRSKWKTVRLSETSVLMELSDTPETQKVYPFSFLYQLEYQLKGGRIHLQMRIENRGSRVMPFSAGIHPYFNVPLSAEGTRDDCYIELPAARRVIPHGNWESWTAEPAPAEKLPVGKDVSGTYFVTDLARSDIRLVDPRSGLIVTLNISEAPRFRFVALWSKATTEPFYCIEPWTALPNSFARKQTELLLLQPSERFTARMWMEITES